MSKESKEQIKNEILAVLYRYSQESDATLLEAIEACHEAASHLLRYVLDNFK